MPTILSTNARRMPKILMTTVISEPTKVGEGAVAKAERHRIPAVAVLHLKYLAFLVPHSDFSLPYLSRRLSSALQLGAAHSIRDVVDPLQSTRRRVVVLRA